MATQNSWIVSWFRGKTVFWQSILEDSGLLSLVRTTGNVARNSWVYPWMASESSSEAVVIDLRDTVTAAPFLDVLDVVFAWIENGWRSSKIRTATSALNNTIRPAVRNSSLHTLLATILQPHESGVRNEERDG